MKAAPRLRPRPPFLPRRSLFSWGGWGQAPEQGERSEEVLGGRVLDEGGVRGAVQGVDERMWRG